MRDDYELYVNSYLSYIYHPKIECVCKDTLVKALENVVKIEKLFLYNCFITGSINSSSQYPTYDCDIIITNSQEDKQEILEILRNIKEIGLSYNLNLDCKYMEDITPFSIAAETPDEYTTMTQTSVVYNRETQIFDSLLKLTKSFRVRKRRRESFDYYKPLHLKEINQNEIKETARVFIDNTDLPMSVEKENPNAFEYCLNRPKPNRNTNA